MASHLLGAFFSPKSTSEGKKFEWLEGLVGLVPTFSRTLFEVIPLYFGPYEDSSKKSLNLGRLCVVRSCGESLLIHQFVGQLTN